MRDLNLAVRLDNFEPFGTIDFSGPGLTLIHLAASLRYFDSSFGDLVVSLKWSSKLILVNRNLRNMR